MLDIIILIFIIDYIGKAARSKGMPVLRWRLRMFFSYFGAELAVAFLSFYLTQQLTIAAISGSLGGIMGAVVVFQWFKKEAALSSDEKQE